MKFITVESPIVKDRPDGFEEADKFFRAQSPVQVLEEMDDSPVTKLASVSEEDIKMKDKHPVQLGNKVDLRAAKVE